jgi:hypothetical protein
VIAGGTKRVGVRDLGTLPQVVAALWLIVGGLWLAGGELLALFLGQPFNSTHLAIGVVLLVVGGLFAAYTLRRLEGAGTQTEED